MKAWVDDQRCRGHGVCLTICPDVFTLTDDGYAVAQEGEIRTRRGGSGRRRKLPRAGDHRVQNLATPGRPWGFR